jgi:glycine cleavage system H lipoate-binding protein
MTALLVACTIAVFLGIEYWRRRALQTKAREQPQELFASTVVRDDLVETPAGLFFGPGHTWTRIEPDGSVCVGIDDFVGKILGHVDGVDVVPVGTAVGHRDAAFVLRQRDKSAAFVSPCDGVVTRVNEEALQNPDAIRNDPYGTSWLLRVRPQRLAEGVRKLRIGEDAQSWMREEVSRLIQFLERQSIADGVGVTLHDGGVPVQDVLEQLDGGAWERFEKEFLTS